MLNQYYSLAGPEHVCFATVESLISVLSLFYSFYQCFCGLLITLYCSSLFIILRFSLVLDVIDGSGLPCSGEEATHYPK